MCQQLVTGQGALVQIGLLKKVHAWLDVRLVFATGYDRFGLLLFGLGGKGFYLLLPRC